MHWRHVSITTTPCWGSRLVALRAHVVLAERISPSVSARPGPARPARRYGMQGLACWLHAWRWPTWQCFVWPPTHVGALLWRHMHMVYTGRNTFPDRCKTHWNSAHRVWRRALEPGDWKQFHKHPKFQFTHILTNSRHKLTKSKFLAMFTSPMQTEKVAIFYVVNAYGACAWVVRRLHTVRSESDLTVSPSSTRPAMGWARNRRLGSHVWHPLTPMSEERERPSNLIPTVQYEAFGLALELQFTRKSYVSVIMLQVWAPQNTEILRGVCSHVKAQR